MFNQFEKAKSILTILIPEIYHERIVFLFKDEDPNNWEPDNVTYKFKDAPLECPFYPGFYYIPRYSKYAINKNGVIRNILTGKIKSWSKTTPAKNSIRGGYVVTSAVADTGLRRDLTRHRAMSLTFLNYDKHPGNFIINHKNGIGGDDWVDNLEFCTYGRNTKHAYDLGLYSNKVVSVDALNWKTNVELSFPTIQSCYEYFNDESEKFGINLITSRLNNGNNKKYEDGWRFKKPSETWLPLNDRVRQSLQNRVIVGRNIFEKQVIVFGSISDAAEITGLNQGTIRTQCAEKTKLPINNWQFRYKEDFCGWPTYTEQQISIFRDYPTRPGDGVEVYDIDKNEILFFTSPEKAADYFEISPITAAKLARYEGTRKNRFKFKLIKIRENY